MRESYSKDANSEGEIIRNLNNFEKKFADHTTYDDLEKSLLRLMKAHKQLLSVNNFDEKKLLNQPNILLYERKKNTMTPEELTQLKTQGRNKNSIDNWILFKSQGLEGLEKKKAQLTEKCKFLENDLNKKINIFINFIQKAALLKIIIST